MAKGKDKQLSNIEIEERRARRSRRRTNRELVSFPVAPPRSELPVDYAETLAEIKTRIRQERLRTVMAVNSAMVLLYWDVGRVILTRQQREGWGAKVIDRLSADLREVYPKMRGLSPRNLKYMRAFAAAWPDAEFVQQVAAQIPWFHHCVLLDRVGSAAAREWYIHAARQEGWSRNVLQRQINRRAHERQGKALTNFKTTLPPDDSDMAEGIFKDPYLFDFLGTADLRREQEVERALVDHIQQFLLELGRGFAFVGRQVHLAYASSDHYVDLLFYHVKLRCYVVVELKTVPFDTAFLGPLNGYLTAVDGLLRGAFDTPSIGLLLCCSKKQIAVEYALRDVNRPLGVAAWETALVDRLPEYLKRSLPTVEELEAELGAGVSTDGACSPTPAEREE
jgi:predicted nuclease of restriction endonuclease-like (RecB) superfamily